MQLFLKSLNKKRIQAEAEVVPSSSLVEVEVEVEVGVLTIKGLHWNKKERLCKN